jgi:hypothetical protein
MKAGSLSSPLTRPPAGGRTPPGGSARVSVAAWLALVALVVVGGAMRAAVAAHPSIEHRSSDEYDYERIALLADDET